MNIPFLLLCVCAIASAKDLLELQGDSFELALTTYKYIAILFIDESRGSNVRREWKKAADLIDDMPNDSEIAVMNCGDEDTKELVEAHGITLPAVRVFRRGIMTEYRGPYDAAGIAKFVMEDAQPSVKKLTTINEMKALLENNAHPVLFGLFNEEDIVDENFEGYGIDAWGQYQAAADALRGHASFYLVDSKEIMNMVKLKPSDLPVIYMDEGDGFLKYTGEILEMNLIKWVLYNSSPTLGDLSSGELYAAHFFASQKLKFILFVTRDMIASTEVLENWKAIAEVYKGKAIFAYISEDVASIELYFDMNMNIDAPMIAAHLPTIDHKYKSSRIDVTDISSLESFVSGVISGSIQEILKSEPIPTSNSGSIRKAVGHTVVDIVSNENKDVLLMVYTPWCPNCRKVVPMIEMLGKAVEAESRIVIAKIDMSVNDIPASWEVKTYPTLLWFPAKDKPYASIPTPKPYWDAELTLPDLVGFLQRQSSFDMKTLKVATMEQIGSLVADEELIRSQYDQDERHFKRNENVHRYENPWVHYMIGEVVFDGTRMHMAVMIFFSACVVFELLWSIWCYLSSSTANNVIRKKKST